VSLVKLLFDECLPRGLITTLPPLTQHIAPQFSVELDHVLNLFGAGTPDSVWVPKIANEQWIVVSADRARGRGGLNHLQNVCDAFSVTHVLLSVGMHQSKTATKVSALIGVWDQLCSLNAAPKGSKWKLRQTTTVNKPYELVQAPG